MATQNYYKRSIALFIDCLFLLSSHFFLFIIYYFIFNSIQSPEPWMQNMTQIIVFSHFSIPLVILSFIESTENTSPGKTRLNLKYNKKDAPIFIYLLRNILKYTAVIEPMKWFVGYPTNFIYIQWMGLALLGINLIFLLLDIPALHEYISGCYVTSKEFFHDSSSEKIKLIKVFDGGVYIMGFFSFFFVMLLGARGYVQGRNEFRKDMTVKNNAYTFQSLVETYAVDEKVYPITLKELYEQANQPEAYWREVKNPFLDNDQPSIGYGIGLEEGHIKPGMVTYKPIGNPPASYVIYAYNRNGARIQDKGRDFFLSNS